MTIERDYSDKDLRAALGSSPPLEKMKMDKTGLPEIKARDGALGNVLQDLLTEIDDRLETLEDFRARYLKLLDLNEAAGTKRKNLVDALLRMIDDGEGEPEAAAYDNGGTQSGWNAACYHVRRILEEAGYAP